MSHATAGRALVEIIAGCNMIGPAMIARVIRRDGVTGTPGTADDSPVGNWVLACLRARDVPAHSYEWIEAFRVYDIAGELIAQVPITDGVLHELECRINEGHPDYAGLARNHALTP